MRDISNDMEEFYIKELHVLLPYCVYFFLPNSEMKHQLEYASAGSNQVTIITNNGIQARFVKDPKGNIYLLIDNVVINSI